MKRSIIFATVFITLVTSIGTAFAERSTYAVCAHIRNKSKIASYILENRRTFATVYRKHRTVCVFSNNEHTSSFLLGIIRGIYEDITADLGLSQIKKEGISIAVFALNESHWHSFGLDPSIAAF